MARKNRAPTSHVTEKAVPAQAPAARPPLTIVPAQPDGTKETFLTIGFGVDPYEEYQRLTDFYARREVAYNLFMRDTACAAIRHSVASELASQEIFITPTQANPSASTLVQAKRVIDLVNNSMNRPNGVGDWLTNFLEGYWGSKTGAFILTPRDASGNILYLGMLPPLLPRPYYGWNAGQPLITPTSQQIPLAEGIWFTQPGTFSATYFTLPADHYFQACYGAVGYGAFLDGNPIAEQQLSNIVTHTALSDYLRRTLNTTDDAQVIGWGNVDMEEVKQKAAAIARLRQMRKDGEKIDPKDEGTRLHVSARDPDKPIQIMAVNLRTFPEGFDPDKTLSMYEERIAIGFGVNARRAAPDTQKERFGNATLGAMQNGDEPGVRGARAAVSGFITSFLLDGLPMRSQFMGTANAENYGLVQRDNVVAQTISQVAQVFTPEQLQSYAARMGMLTPADVGQESFRTADGTPVTQGWISLRDRLGHLLTYEHVAQINTAPLPIVAAQKARDPQYSPCAEEAVARFTQWAQDELPTTVTVVNNQLLLDRLLLEQEVDDITVELFHDLMQCSKANGGRSSDLKVRMYYDAWRGGFYNLFGSPQLKVAALARPKDNLFDTLWNLAGKVAMGTVPPAALTALALGYAEHLRRYANAARGAQYLVYGLAHPNVPVTWVMGTTERHCSLCPAFAHRYQSFTELLSHTGGLVPGDVRLTCSGNCLCHLEFGASEAQNG